jgi:hypothetical protein
LQLDKIRQLSAKINLLLRFAKTRDSDGDKVKRTCKIREAKLSIAIGGGFGYFASPEKLQPNQDEFSGPSTLRVPNLSVDLKGNRRRVGRHLCFDGNGKTQDACE